MKDLVYIQKAIELSYYGIEDFSFNRYYSSVSKKAVSRLSDNVKDFMISFTDDCKDVLGNYFLKYLIREKDSVYLQNYLKRDIELYNYDRIEVNKKVLCKCIESLYTNNIYSFPLIDIKFKDPDASAKYNNYTLPKESAIAPAQENLKHNRKNLIAMLYFDDVAKDLSEQIVYQYDNPLDKIMGIKAIDNRVWIEIPNYVKNIENLPDKWRYIVISKNPFDYFFCSYGNSFQSCFALNSISKGYQGFIPYSIIPGQYMIYISDGKDYKQSLIDGEKWYIPQMYVRCWGWLSTNGSVLIDKPYSNEINKSIWLSFRTGEFIKKVFGNDCVSSEKHSLKYGKDLLDIYKEYRYKSYYDSILYDNDTTVADNANEFCFKYNKGLKYFMGNIRGGDNFLTSDLKTIRDIDDNISLNYDICFDNITGILHNYKKCPITGLPIGLEEEQSKYAKHFSKPIDNLLVITYCDGFYKQDASSYLLADLPSDLTFDRFSYKYTPLNTLKEKLRLLNKNVLFRVINDKQVTFIRYKEEVKDA